MTLKTIAATAAKNVGIEPPDTVIGNAEPDAVKLLQFINETGQELTRRVDWSGLRKNILIEGTGFDANYDLPADYVRLVEGWSVKANGAPVRGGVTTDEWNSLTPVMGAPRYFRLVGSAIGFYPYPAEGSPVTMSYISGYWVSGGGAEFSVDTQTALVPERLLEMGAIWRFKRHMSADYSDYLAEYEAALMDLSRADGGIRQP